MRYYSEDLQRLQQEILEKKRTKAKLSDLQIQQAELKERTAKLEKLMVKEQKDVDRLNRGSLSAFFYRASGQMEEKLSKEEAEAYAARVKYETARQEMNFGLLTKILPDVCGKLRVFRNVKSGISHC